MAEFEELEFVIPAYTPETMPLPRLLEYLTQIAAVVGVPNEMHLVRIDPSSTKPVFKMPTEIAGQARERATAVRLGRGSPAQRTAYNRIRQMVRLDSDKPASLKDSTGVILSFFPEEDAAAIVATVRQHTTFDGVLTRVGGVGDFSAIQMQDLVGKVFSGFNATRTLAKEMGRLLFEPLRVIGIGNWERTRAGAWNLDKMLIQSYEHLSDEAAEETLARLKAAPVNWPENADALLQAERGGAE